MSRASVASALARRNETRDPGRHDGVSTSSIAVSSGPGSRCARPGHESGGARRVRSRGARIEPLAVAGFTMSNSAVFFVPAARCCARVGLYPFAPDPKRGGRSADRRTISVVAFARRDDPRAVRRGASHDAGRSPLGAPPWRFSAGGRASISGIASGSVQRCSSQPGRHAWRAVSRTSRARGYEPRPQDATPRSAFQDRLRKTPLHERGWESLYYKFVT